MVGGNEITTPPITQTNTTNDIWVTVNGADRDVVNSTDRDGLISAYLPTSAVEEGVSRRADVNVDIFLCDNPWPKPPLFPFMDSGNNCNGCDPAVSTCAGCYNTNFKLYYCRDNGVAGSVGDLPSLNQNLIVKGSDAGTAGAGIVKEFLWPNETAASDQMGGNDGETRGTGGSPVTAGKVGAAYKFTGATGDNSLIALPSEIVDVLQGGNFTISSFVKFDPSTKPLDDGDPDTFSPANYSLMGSGYYYSLWYQFERLNFALVAAGNEAAFSGPLNADQWYPVSITYDGSKIILYVDGQKVGEKIPPRLPASVSPNYYLGGFSPTLESKFKGLLDEVKFYDRALTAEEIQNNSDNGLVAYYPFEPTTGAIGIRVAKNTSHLSPLAWYRSVFDPNRQGNPQSLVVDSYQGMREGRTTYVDAADLNEDDPNTSATNEAGTNIYSNIYLMSYSEAADNNTREIYNRLTRGWFFNASTTAAGGLPDAGTCSLSNGNGCFIDAQCERENAGYCDSAKAKLTRDTKRLADLGDVNLLLENYNNQNGSYPTLTAGSYVAGCSLSVWPSWQASLGNTLGSALPTDPINRLDGCQSPPNNSNNDPNTCWNQGAKTMGAPTDGYVYSYFNDVISGHGEYNNNWSPATNYFTGFVAANLCERSMTCGTDVDSSENSNYPITNFPRCDVNEDCSTCWTDCGCGTGTVCRQESGAYQCLLPVEGDTDWDDDWTFNNTDRCPWDPNRQTDPGQCGCGDTRWTGGRQTDTSPGQETDTDIDNTPDCKDLCPNDANRIAPGRCGCNSTFSETSDGDGDGTPDCNDDCPDDPDKTQVGACGCNVPDLDPDRDGVYNCPQP